MTAGVAATARRRAVPYRRGMRRSSLVLPLPLLLLATTARADDAADACRRTFDAAQAANQADARAYFDRVAAAPDTLGTMVQAIATPLLPLDDARAVAKELAANQAELARRRAEVAADASPATREAIAELGRKVDAEAAELTKLLDGKLPKNVTLDVAHHTVTGCTLAKPSAIASRGDDHPFRWTTCLMFDVATAESFFAIALKQTSGATAFAVDIGRNAAHLRRKLFDEEVVRFTIAHDTPASCRALLSSPNAP